MMKKMKKVIIYTTPSCMWCQKAKEYFKAQGVSFEEVDVSRNREKAQEMIRKSGQMGVPVIDIEGDVVIGFDQPSIDRILGL